MTEKEYPYSYRAYGLNILSHLPVSGFESIPVEEADVFIHEGLVPGSLSSILNKGVLYQANDREFLLRIEHISAFYVKNGNEIIVQRLGIASDGEISAFLTGSSFGALLHQRRLLPLHASTVLFKEKCLVFAGVSGIGKTTLAAAIVKAGGILLADDISVIDFSSEKPAVCPAFPAIKIWEDSLKHLGISADGLEPVRGKLKKYYLPVKKFNHEYADINRIFIVQSHNLNTVITKEIKGMNKFRLLKKNTYLFRGIPNTGLEQNHFMLATQLTSRVPITLLVRPTGEFNTSKLVKAISDVI